MDDTSLGVCNGVTLCWEITIHTLGFWAWGEGFGPLGVESSVRQTW